MDLLVLSRPPPGPDGPDRRQPVHRVRPRDVQPGAGPVGRDPEHGTQAPRIQQRGSRIASKKDRRHVTAPARRTWRNVALPTRRYKKNSDLLPRSIMTII